MRNIPRSGVAIVATAVVALVLTGSTPALARARWSIVPSPSPSIFADLSDVTAVSSTDAWAVGQYSDRPILTLIEHWDGTSWTVVPSPNPPHRGAGSGLFAALALSANDVWAVGARAGNSSDKTLVEHWDGSAWTVVPSPSPGASDDLYDLVRHGTSGRLWAVGATQPTFGGPFSPLIEEWTGTKWRVVGSESPPSGGYLFGGTTAAGNDAWAVGQAGQQSNQPLAEHWNGSSWSIVSTPPVSGSASLNSAASVSSSDVWAVGGSSGGALIEHWDGSAWALVPSPTRLSAELLDAVATSSTSVWAVGIHARNGVDVTLTEHWDGAHWSVVFSPSAGDTSVLRAVSTIPGTQQVWAVGSSVSADGSSSATLVELYS